MLVLFDIDGTLLLDDAHAHGAAMLRAMRSVYGVELPDDAIERARPWGKTDPQIARDALRAAGVDEGSIDSGLSSWMQAASAAFVSEADAAATRWRVRPGLADALRELMQAETRLTVLTGNLRAIATAKIEHMGFAEDLDLHIGAYGDDAEDRNRLVPIARERAGTPAEPWPRERTAVIGDTPGDIDAANADSVASAIFSSERYPASALDGARAVISDVQELVETLTGWQRQAAPG